MTGCSLGTRRVDEGLVDGKSKRNIFFAKGKRMEGETDGNIPCRVGRRFIKVDWCKKGLLCPSVILFHIVNK